MRNKELFNGLFEFGIKSWMSKLAPSQQRVIDKLNVKHPHGSVEWTKGKNELEGIAKQHNWETNKKIAIWGGGPPVLTAAGGMAVSNRNQKKSEKRIMKAIKRKK